MKRLLKILAAVAVLIGGPAYAADVNPPLVKAAPSAFACTPASCSGFYAGGVIAGEGTNADILGSGLANSVFANGGLFGGDIGYRVWNGHFFYAAELSALVEAGNTGGVSFTQGKGFVAMGTFKFGASLATLFGGGTPAPSQGPVVIPTQLMPSLMSPYISFNPIWRRNGTELGTGAGAEFVVGPRWTADLGYVYAPPSNGMNALNMVKVGVNYNW